MFPDLKEMFTEKQVVKKPAGAAAGGDGTGEGAEGGEKKPEKLKPIQFMNDVDSKKVTAGAEWPVVVLGHCAHPPTCLPSSWLCTHAMAAGLQHGHLAVQVQKV